MTNVANHKSAIYPHAMAHFSVVMHMVYLVNVLAAEFTVFKSNWSCKLVIDSSIAILTVELTMTGKGDLGKHKIVSQSEFLFIWL